MATRRKNRASTAPPGSASKRSKKSLDLAWGGADDKHIDSDDEVESHEGEAPSSQEDDESEEENLGVKKVRLARQYLEKIEAASDSSSSSASSDEEDDDDKKDPLGRKLQRERLKREGMFERPMADRLDNVVAALQDAVITYHKRPAIPM